MSLRQTMCAKGRCRRRVPERSCSTDLGAQCTLFVGQRSATGITQTCVIGIEAGVPLKSCRPAYHATSPLPLYLPHSPQT